MIEKTIVECRNTRANITNRSGIQFYDSAMLRLVIQLLYAAEIEAIDCGSLSGQVRHLSGGLGAQYAAYLYQCTVCVGCSASRDAEKSKIGQLRHYFSRSAANRMIFSLIFF